MVIDPTHQTPYAQWTPYHVSDPLPTVDPIPTMNPKPIVDPIPVVGSYPWRTPMLYIADHFSSLSIIIHSTLKSPLGI